MSEYKPKVDRTGLPEAEIDVLDNATNGATLGLGNTSQAEPKVVFDPANREKIIMHDDSYIILGGDRISSKASGYGGKGHTKSHMIDLVVGRDPKLSGQPSFKGDAARIYISQKTDVDQAFGTVTGHVGRSYGRSAIGIKADGVRIVAREGIKLITMGKGTTLSTGNKLKTYTGIDLIAGNDEKGLEPIAKAYAVADALEQIIVSLEKTAAVVENFVDAQLIINTTLLAHPLLSPLAATVAPSVTRQVICSKVPLLSHRKKLTLLLVHHLKPFTEKWIGSRYNFTN